MPSAIWEENCSSSSADTFDVVADLGGIPPFALLEQLFLKPLLPDLLLLAHLHPRPVVAAEVTQPVSHHHVVARGDVEVVVHGVGWVRSDVCVWREAERSSLGFGLWKVREREKERARGGDDEGQGLKKRTKLGF